jgi:hypothetical protein
MVRQFLDKALCLLHSGILVPLPIRWHGSVRSSSISTFVVGGRSKVTISGERAVQTTYQCTCQVRIVSSRNRKGGIQARISSSPLNSLAVPPPAA